MVKPKESANPIEQQLADVHRVLEDLFILYALTSGIDRESIRSILGVRTTRISKIMKGVKKARSHGKEKA